MKIAFLKFVLKEISAVGKRLGDTQGKTQGEILGETRWNSFERGDHRFGTTDRSRAAFQNARRTISAKALRSTFEVKLIKKKRNYRKIDSKREKGIPIPRPDLENERTLAKISGIDFQCSAGNGTHLRKVQRRRDFNVQQESGRLVGSVAPRRRRRGGVGGVGGGGGGGSGGGGGRSVQRKVPGADHRTHLIFFLQVRPE